MTTCAGPPPRALVFAAMATEITVTARAGDPAELGARQRVRKRDVSFGPRSPAGAAAWDTFMTLAATTRKLGLDFAAYLTDRFTRAGQIPPLADLISARAAQLAGAPA